MRNKCVKCVIEPVIGMERYKTILKNNLVGYRTCAFGNNYYIHSQWIHIIMYFISIKPTNCKYKKISIVLGHPIMDYLIYANISSHTRNPVDSVWIYPTFKVFAELKAYVGSWAAIPIASMRNKLFNNRAQQPTIMIKRTLWNIAIWYRCIDGK